MKLKTKKLDIAKHLQTDDDISLFLEEMSNTGDADDLIHAGANWVDQDVVVDGNLITSRTPDDLPVFMKAIIAYLG